MHVHGMIVSFSWTTPALLAGAKTMTRRDWTHAHAAKFTVGRLVDAWDRSPRTGKGRKVATIRITREPRRESTSAISRDDYRREGFTWLQEHGYYGQVEDIICSWGLNPREVWVVEFELVSVVGDTSPRSAARREGTECEIPATVPFQLKKTT